MLDTPLMLWELSVTEQRYRAVLEVLAGVPVTEAAERYGVSRQSVHAWLARYRDEGPPGLADRSHKVHAHPWQIPAELESAVCELRRAHREVGAEAAGVRDGPPRPGHGDPVHRVPGAGPQPADRAEVTAPQAAGLYRGGSARSRCSCGSWT